MVAQTQKHNIMSENLKQLIEKAREIESIIAEIRDFEEDSKELSNLHREVSEFLSKNDPERMD